MPNWLVILCSILGWLIVAYVVYVWMVGYAPF
jgi:hypothetical protein